MRIKLKVVFRCEKKSFFSIPDQMYNNIENTKTLIDVKLTCTYIIERPIIPIVLSEGKVFAFRNIIGRYLPHLFILE